MDEAKIILPREMMAKAAGFDVDDDGRIKAPQVEYLNDVLTEFARLVAESEREEALAIMRRLANSSDYEMRDGDLARDLAEQFIRSRTE